MPLILETVSLGKSARKFAGGLELCCSARRIVNALIKDQVTPMLFRKYIVSTRTLFQLTVALVFFLVAAVGAAVAAGPNNAPLLVPYTMTTAAGTPQYSFAATPGIITGYGGDIGFQGSGNIGAAVPYLTNVNGVVKLVPGATLNVPEGFAVDSVGNIYIVDHANDVIREVNSSTGLINIIAGVTPSSCKAVASTVDSYNCTPTPGCADGVAAYQAKIGSGLIGLAVDAFGNVYFTDTTTQSASVIYRGGTQIANFIALVNPAGVAKSGGKAQVGFIYHIAGEVNLSTCAGATSNGGVVIDNAPAFEDTSIANNPIIGATVNSPNEISLDSANNIYIADISNHTTRVINTQATPQTFFQSTVLPGYMRSITDCNASMTTPCPGLTTGQVGTGLNGPVNGIVFNSQNTFDGTDAYGNVYQLNGSGGGTGVPGIYANVAYAGGAPLTNLLNIMAPVLVSVYSANETAFPVPAADTKTPNELPLTYGNGYVALNNLTISSPLPSGYLNVLIANNNGLDIRSTSFKPDSFGSFYYYDNHFPEINRVDQYTGDAILLYSDWAAHPRATSSVSGINTITNLNPDLTAHNSSNYNQPASLGISTTSSPALNPWDCVYGTNSNPFKWGPQTYDPAADGCPGMLAESSTSGKYYTDNDSQGNLYFGDSGNNLIREITVGNQFPATPVVPAGTGAWSASTTYAANAVVSYTDGLNYISLVGSNVANVPNMTPADWALVTVTQPIQVHFDVSNPPVTGGASFSSPASDGSIISVSIPDGPNLGFTTNSFSIAAGSDFTINTFTPELPMGSVFKLSGSWGNTSTTTNFALYPAATVLGVETQGLPTCAQLGASSPDNSWDCLVYVNFNPSQPGMRVGQLTATTANGSVYNFQLTGQALGGQLAIDGGQQATVAATGLGATSSVAVTATGTVYIADSTNNRIVVEPAGGGTQTVIGPSIAVTNIVYGQTTSTGVAQTLSGPMGVAVDAANNVYIADTGNNRILKYNPLTKTAAVLGSYLWIPGSICDGGIVPAAGDCVFQGYSTQAPGSSIVNSSFGSAGVSTNVSILNEPGASVTATTPPPQYQFKAPHGLAVDQWDNVYVADTGNAAIVEIPGDVKLGGATPLFQYAGGPTFTQPVAVAVDPKGFIYVADQQNVAGQIVRIPPGGGDLQPASSGPTSALSVLSSLPLFGGQNINNPNGVAVDAAGNVYVSDSSSNVVWEAPAVGPPSGSPFTLSFTGLSSPAGLALDANGNLYVADSGNKQILIMNRISPTAPFGLVPEKLGASGVAGTPTGCPVLGGSSPCTGVLTVTNTGNQPVTLASTFASISGSGSSAYSVTTTCNSTNFPNGIPVGTTCTISPLFTPSTTGANGAATLTVNGKQTVALTANGSNAEVSIVLTSSAGLTPAAGTTGANIIATVSQPHVTGAPTPTGTVTFSYVIDAGTIDAGLCGAAGTPTVVNLVNGVATYPMPSPLLQGLAYTVSAVFTPGGADTTDSTTTATPIVVSVPGIPVVVTVTSTLAQLTYTYGGTVPTINGTITAGGVPVAGAYLTSGAGQFTATNSYPIQVNFTTATNGCSYGNPGVTTGQANVIEKPASLSVVIPAYSTVYGAASFNYASGMVITGAVGNDLKKLSATFSVVKGSTTPADSSTLDVNPASPAVNPYTVYPTMTGKPIGNYTLTITNGTDTVTPAPSGISITANKTSIAIASAGTGSTVSGATYAISVGSLVTAGKGIPTGTVSVTDYFVPITSTVYTPTPTTGVFPTVNGAIQWPSGTIVIPPCSATVTTNCNPVVALGGTVSAPTPGQGTFTLPNLNTPNAPPTGTHYLSFAYSGDPAPAVAGASDGLGDFACSVVGQVATSSCPSTGTVPFALIIDNPDFTITSATGPISVLPGNIPNGNGLPSAPNQNGSYPQSTIMQIGGILSLSGQVNLSCTTQAPSYESCWVGQVVVVNTATTYVPYATISSGSTVAVIFDVSTPATLPLGFSTSKLRTSATRTVLAFLPFGVLAFCVRRRRRLSKALWMLIAIAAVSVGMSGCGGNQVDFYTPIPTGPQTVTVTGTYTNPTTPTPAGQWATMSRSYVIPITIN
jgi:sugar lactone lactonase YvrE